MHAVDDGGGGGSSYGTFVNELFEKLDRFAELYHEARIEMVAGVASQSYTGFVEGEVSEVTSSVQPFLAAADASSLGQAIVANPGLIERLTKERLDGDGGEGSRIENALGFIQGGVAIWQGYDADRFDHYCESVATALHTQEALIQALGALADVHGRIVARARGICWISSMRRTRRWGAADSARPPVSPSSIPRSRSATLTTDGAAAALGIAGALAGAGASFTGGGADSVGAGEDLDLDAGSCEGVRIRVLALIEELKTDVKEKNNDLRDVTARLRDIAHGGGGGIHPKELLPLKPDLHHDFEPVDFKLPDYVGVRP